MTLDDVRSRYLNFFKKRNHAIIPSAPMIPENDPTTLFTSSGMQPLIPYLLGEKHPKGTRLVNSQMCFRAEDIDEVGDNRHTTFFEMLGNWSLGDYFKKEQIPWVFEFLTDKEEGIGLDPRKLYVTVFSGDEKSDMSLDEETIHLWKELFAKKEIDAKLIELETEENAQKVGMQNGRIFSYGAKKNWWSRSGEPIKMPSGEPGGPDSEIFYDFGTPHDKKFGEQCHPNCDCGRFVEIGNSVFMQFIKQDDNSFGELPKKNVDFGGGLERLTAATNNNPDIFSIDIFQSARDVLEKCAKKEYGTDKSTTRSFRIILDHMRACAFMIANGIVPSNTEQGYVLRRLIRRSIREVDKLGITESVLADVAQGYGEVYVDEYPIIHKAEKNIREELEKEEERFKRTLTQGLREFEKEIDKNVHTESTSDGSAGGAIAGAEKDNVLSGEFVFTLFQTYGFPFELTEELATEKGMIVDKKDFDKRMKKHQELSRGGASQKFKGGLADTGAQTTALHTCTHLMLAGLRKYVGDHVHQAGSNITAQRIRFDFTHTQKVPRDILDKVEMYVNDVIDKDCIVTMNQISKDTARADGVEASFWDKYPDIVNMYEITADNGEVYSRELCGGPHVKNTSVIHAENKHFKIIKEGSSSAGVRRIKAVLE